MYPRNAKASAEPSGEGQQLPPVQSKLNQPSPHLGPVLITVPHCVLKKIASQLLQQSWSQVNYCIQKLNFSGGARSQTLD